MCFAKQGCTDISQISKFLILATKLSIDNLQRTPGLHACMILTFWSYMAWSKGRARYADRLIEVCLWDSFLFVFNFKTPTAIILLSKLIWKLYVDVDLPCVGNLTALDRNDVLASNQLMLPQGSIRLMKWLWIVWVCSYGYVYGYVRALHTNMCAYTFMWIWVEAIIKVLNLRIYGLWSKQCLDKVCAPLSCWNSDLQEAHKNAKLSHLTFCCYTLLCIRFLFISSSLLQSLDSL